jgi:DNA-binding IclR family transcriptional regulator
MEGHDKTRRIQSVEIGFSILRTLAENRRGMKLTELSNATGMHKSQLYRYLNSFVLLGVLNREESENPAWMLGPELISLGNVAFENLDLAKQAAPKLTELRDTLNETVALSIWRERGPYFVQWLKSNRLVNIGVDTGSYVPLYSATGKIFRAYLPEEKTQYLYDQEVKAGRITPKCYDLEIREIRVQGLSKTESGLIPGIAALSTPIFYPGDQLAGALSIIGLSGVLDISFESTPVQTLLKTANEISRKLGYVGTRYG